MLAGSLMHAAGHASLAAAGGVLARSLAGGDSPMDARSTVALERVGYGDALLGLAILGLIAALVKLVGGVTASWAEARVAGDAAGRLRLAVLDRVLDDNAVCNVRHDDHGATASKDAVGRVAALTTHVAEVERGLVGGVFAEVRALLALAPLAALLVILAPRLAGSAVLALVAFGALVTVARRALRRGYRRASEEVERLLGAADQAVRHADLWKTYGAEERVRSHLRRLGRTLSSTAAKLRARATLLSATSEVLGAAALVVALALVGLGLVGGVDRGRLVPFAIAFFMAYKPLRELVEARLARARATEALRAALGEPGDRGANDVGPAPRARAPRAWSEGELVVEGLVSAHGDHAPLDLRVGFGRIIALVGPTGVGKTSLLRVLLGLDAARAGRVLWAGEDLEGRGSGPAERPFAWVPQDAPVLAASLVDNVALGAAPSRDEAARGEEDARDVRDVTEAVLAELGARHLARELGDEELGSRRPVSGGERQWIAVARALATRQPVLLLDEPTSSLDPAAQARMIAAIAALRGKRTVVVVTHRSEPLAIADVVVRLGPAESGRREDAEHRTRRDGRPVRVNQLPVEDVRAGLSVEPDDELAREGVDAPAAE